MPLDFYCRGVGQDIKIADDVHLPVGSPLSSPATTCSIICMRKSTTTSTRNSRSQCELTLNKLSGKLGADHIPQST
jgi:hypothetical protein